MTTIRCQFPIATKRVPVAVQAPMPRVARMLALAHHIERLVDEKRLADYAAAAGSLGVTRARMTQVMKLLLLAPELQHRILLHEITASERGLRVLSAKSNWQEQLDLWAPASAGHVDGK